ncbi:hypothetical protein MPH_08120 [Macrophomina phaseolina MS6]|uniref:Uncharacterized protein n=1 Tax=Macrophomina phaseolina (strain MS6) TaxID=1126212 RepID=K2RPE9_MACPH|nr:hypothetical protein MPH_08120 [Macrophomina phaseolina MS6]
MQYRLPASLPAIEHQRPSPHRQSTWYVVYNGVYHVGSDNWHYLPLNLAKHISNRSMSDWSSRSVACQSAQRMQPLSGLEFSLLLGLPAFPFTHGAINPQTNQKRKFPASAMLQALGQSIAEIHYVPQSLTTPTVPEFRCKPFKLEGWRKILILRTACHADVSA